MVSVSAHAPTRMAVPHGATLLASLLARANSWLDSLRGRREQEIEFTGRAGDAARVRRFAQQVMADDPRFAADLLAAADRYERE